MTTIVKAWAASAPGAALEPFTYELGALAPEDVEIEVDYCGICHSDLSMLDNDWGITRYPFVPGHEAVGRVVALGSKARGLALGQTVGIGWSRSSCMHCHSCIEGEHHLCGEVKATIVGRHGGFGERLRAHWAWAIPLPAGIDPALAGPLYCGGITVFAPLLEHDVRPTQRVGVVGIGGLGHMAVRFLRAWGCEVTAFTSSPAKYEEAKALGAHHVVASTDSAALAALAGRLDFVLVTANVTLDWNAFIGVLAPKGRLHVVGAVLDPIPVPVFALMGRQGSLSSSPTGSPAAVATMLDFCARHGIVPQVESYPLSRVNEAMQHLRDGRARYRIVLDMHA
jgi:alcohol/geraniol dehydrogenase (NADP+)